MPPVSVGMQSSSNAVDRVAACLARIFDPAGEGERTFTEVFATAALVEARDIEQQLKAGTPAVPLAGMVVSVKDLFDVRGTVTRAGSLVLSDQPEAVNDAAAVSRLRSAGAIVIGKTNMSEFAYSGLGLNPHFGTPRAPFDRSIGRIPGGSSSGAAVSVADGMATAALGTDTGGSVRIPAAFCGLCGFKPTQARVSREGALPLSPTLDCVGPIARDVETVARLDAVLTGDSAPLADLPLRGLRFGAIRNYVWEGADLSVANAFEAAVSHIVEAGALVADACIPELEELPTVNAKGGFAAAESYAWHEKLIKQRATEYDPRILARIMRGVEAQTDDIALLNAERRRLKSAAELHLRDFDALLLPTVPIQAPTIRALEADEDLYHAANLLLLRNPSIANFFDWCSLSLPLELSTGGSAGLMLFGRSHDDRKVLAIGRALERPLYKE